jgi:predicted acylesterase/phospholipase RssA
MSNEVLVALIGLAGSAIGSLCGVLVSSKLTQYRIEQLEKKVEKHNNLVERTYQLEQREKLLEEKLEAHEILYAEKIKVANHRIDDLEHHHEI